MSKNLKEFFKDRRWAELVMGLKDAYETENLRLGKEQWQEFYDTARLSLISDIQKKLKEMEIYTKPLGKLFDQRDEGYNSALSDISTYLDSLKGTT